MSLEWSDQLFGTGVDEIDEQHKELFAATNELLSAFTQGKGDMAIRPMLDFLQRYMETHFAHEEALMAARNSPAAADNKREHDVFRLRFAALRARYATGGSTMDSQQLARDLQVVVCDWLTSHIMAVDTKLRED